MWEDLHFVLDFVVVHLINIQMFFLFFLHLCLQCFDTVGWAAGRASGLYNTKWWHARMVICLGQGADCMWPSWCHCHSLSRVCVRVCVRVHVCVFLHLSEREFLGISSTVSHSRCQVFYKADILLVTETKGVTVKNCTDRNQWKSFTGFPFSAPVIIFCFQQCITDLCNRL